MRERPPRAVPDDRPAAAAALRHEPLGPVVPPRGARVAWTEVRVRGVNEATRDAVVALLVNAGGAAVVEASPTELVTHLAAAPPADAIARAIRAACPGAVVEQIAVGEIDWAARWPTRVGVQRVGRIAIAPPWLATEITDAEIPIIIEPAMAFGTGEHETTRGVLRLMQRVVQPGDRVADLGTGSAVLAIAAAKLGAARVAAIELDADALPNAEANVARNDVGRRVTVVEGDAALVLPLVAPVRVILANILSSVLLALSPAMRSALAPGGQAILSGILATERDGVVAALHGDGWELGDEDHEGEWWSGVIAP